MRHNILTTLLLSGAMMLSGFSVMAKENPGHRGQSGKRTEQTRPSRSSNNSRPSSRPTSRPSNSRPSSSSVRPNSSSVRPNSSGNKHDNGNNHRGSSTVRPDNGSNNHGGSSVERPGNGNNHGGSNIERPGNGNNHGGSNIGRPGNGNNPGRPGYNPGRPDYRPGHSYARPGGQYRPNVRPAKAVAYRPHPYYSGYHPRPSVGINISFGGLNFFYSNGLFYTQYSPGQFQIALPPIGLVVNSLFNPSYQYINNGYYYLSEGVLYSPIVYNGRPAYQVVDYYY